MPGTAAGVTVMIRPEMTQGFGAAACPSSRDRVDVAGVAVGLHTGAAQDSPAELHDCRVQGVELRG